MNVGEVIQFLRMLGCEKIYAGSGQWVKATCPLQYRHNEGRDKSPSFAISVNPGDMSNCRCLACGIHGDLMALLWRMEVEGRRVRPALPKFLAEHNQLNVEKIEEREPDPSDLGGRVRAAKRRKYVPPPPRKSRFVHPDDEPQAEVPEKVLQQMLSVMPDDVFDYLTRAPDHVRGVKGRSLTPATISEWELGWHIARRRICIPIRDEDGKLVALSGRAYGKQKPKYLHSRFKRDRVLFGEHKRDRMIRTGYLFEGFFQAIYSWQCGYVNTMARMGTHLSRQQAEKLVRWFDRLIIVPDGDKAGDDAAERDRITLSDLSFDYRTGEAGRTYKIEQIDIVKLPRKRDIDDLPEDQAREILGPRNTS